MQANKIIALHGYCSGDAWGDKLPGAYKFEDYDQNRSHDEFALELISQMDMQYSSGGVGCSIIAHSQGGAAALHLYSYYWSCLDNAPSSGRLIQTIGTPFQGSALAGNAAVLGSVFGIGCGTNYDMTYGGASTWLAGIPTWARAQVYYYTTSFTDKWWRYDYCNIVTESLLGDPDDGATEKAKGQLSGANSKGHKTGYCHTSEMREPKQGDDR